MNITVPTEHEAEALRKLQDSPFFPVFRNWMQRCRESLQEDFHHPVPVEALRVSGGKDGAIKAILDAFDIARQTPPGSPGNEAAPILQTAQVPPTSF